MNCPLILFNICFWNGLEKDLKEHVKAAHKHHFVEGVTLHSRLPGCFAFVSNFGELFMYNQQIKGGRYYAAVQMIGTSSEASKYKCEFTLRAADGIEQINKTFLVQGYSEDWEKMFNSEECLKLDEDTVKQFLEDIFLNLTVKLSRV